MWSATWNSSSLFLNLTTTILLFLLLSCASVCPPYNDMDFDDLVRRLEESGVLSSNSFLVFEYPKEVSGSLKKTMGSLHQLVNRKYGRTTVAIYGPEGLS